MDLKQPEPRNPGANLARRAFILSAAGAVSAIAFWGIRRSTVAAARPLAPNEGPANVTIAQFGPDGKPTGTLTVRRIIRTDDEWKRQLPTDSYWVTRHEDTERPAHRRGERGEDRRRQPDGSPHRRILPAL